MFGRVAEVLPIEVTEEVWFMTEMTTVVLGSEQHDRGKPKSQIEYTKISVP